MPSLYQLKPAFQRLLRPAVGRLARAGVTANQVTVAAALLSLGVGAAIARWPDDPRLLLLLPAALLVRMALNAADGMMAREHGMKSRLGGLLNELGDAVSDAALYLPLALVPGFPAALQTVAVALALVTEVAGLAALGVGAERRYDGPMGKSDRALVYGAVGFALGLGVPAGGWLTAVVAAVAVLAAATVVQRLSRALAKEAR